MGNFITFENNGVNLNDDCNRECENPDCYEEIIDEVNDILFELSKNNSQQDNHLAKLVNEFEDVLIDTEYLCLDKLENPIKEAALSLRNLDSSSSLCNCRDWGPDSFINGKWTCDKCKNKCKCDKQDWRDTYNNDKVNNYVDHEISKNKEKGSIDAGKISHLEITRNNHEIPLEVEKINEKLCNSTEMDKKDDGIYCPCGCGFFQQGHFKLCECGCDNFVEIIDDENISCYSTGFSSERTGEDGSTVELYQTKCRVKDKIGKSKKNVNDDDAAAAPCLQNPFINSTDNNKRQQHMADNFRVDRVVLDSLWLAWDIPEILDNIWGYEILINGVIASRIGSATRNQAILTSVDFDNPIYLTINVVSSSSTTTANRILASSTITFLPP